MPNLNRADLPEYSESIPSFTQFDPRFIPWQMQVTYDMERQYDYSKGVHEILLSGAVGSAKSLFMAHRIVKTAVKYPGAKIIIGRRALPDLKDTLYRKILDHLHGALEYDVDYRAIDTSARIIFWNRSEIISKSWADGKTFKVRSIEASCAAVEEVAENNENDSRAIVEIISRCGRQNHVKEKWFMTATNPDSPSHWAYRRWIGQKHYLRHVYYSITKDNPFLPPEYERKLREDYDPKMAARMLDGRWLDIMGETIYHQYDADKHEVEFGYKVDRSYPIHFSWDFNIGEGKPMSCVFYQVIDGIFHVFDEVVIEGARTESVLEEAAGRGMFEHETKYLCHGDASGKHKDTRSNLSDYEIIDKFMQRYITRNGNRLQYEREVPRANPEIRKRHNTVNAYLCNDLGQVRILVYPRAKTLREGLKLTRLRKGAEYVEDDSMYYQHITTALGYGVCWHDLTTQRPRSTQREL